MNLLQRVLKRLEPETVHAHCDIPCGIYDPHHAQVAAHTVVRMMDLIAELGPADEWQADQHNKLTRYVAAKEEHAELVKREVRIIWGDYFKPEHLESMPDLHDVVWDIMRAAGKCRQSVDAAAANQLLQLVNRFATMFWQSKGKESAEATAAYPTEKPIVLPQLG